MHFKSDNNSGVAQSIIEAVIAEAGRSDDSYGRDDLTQKLDAVWSDVFETQVHVLPVTSGTAANSLALFLITPTHGRVYCHEYAHLAVDEANAPGFFMPGLTLTGLPGAMGKFTAEKLKSALANAPWNSVNCSQPTAISITQANEFGVVYRLDEVCELATIAHDRGLAVHMDGARLGNAIATLGVSPADATWRSGVDVLSLGANKNGCFLTDAVIVFGAQDRQALWYKAKQSGHLTSKLRFLSAQLLAYAAQGRWLEMAAQANAAAQRLAKGLSNIDNSIVVNDVDANMVFARFTENMTSTLRSCGFRFHTTNIGTARFVTSYDTKPSDVDCLIDAVTNIRRTT